MTPLQCGVALFDKDMRVKNAYDEGLLKDTIFERDDKSMRHSLREYWATHTQADLTDLAFQPQSLCAIWGSSNKSY